MLSLLLGTLPASATEPCPPNPCLNSDNSLNRVSCTASAEWIATGELTHIKNDPKGPPLNKNFATFTFVPSHFEKGTQLKYHYKFTVGWCENPTELPNDTSGLFRVYGGYNKLNEMKPYYLHLAKVHDYIGATTKPKQSE